MARSSANFAENCRFGPRAASGGGAADLPVYPTRGLWNTRDRKIAQPPKLRIDYSITVFSSRSISRGQRSEPLGIRVPRGKYVAMRQQLDCSGASAMRQFPQRRRTHAFIPPAELCLVWLSRLCGNKSEPVSSVLLLARCLGTHRLPRNQPLHALQCQHACANCAPGLEGRGLKNCRRQQLVAALTRR